MHSIVKPLRRFIGMTGNIRLPRRRRIVVMPHPICLAASNELSLRSNQRHRASSQSMPCSMRKPNLRRRTRCDTPILAHTSSHVSDLSNHNIRASSVLNFLTVHWFFLMKTRLPSFPTIFREIGFTYAAQLIPSTQDQAVNEDGHRSRTRAKFRRPKELQPLLRAMRLMEYLPPGRYTP